MKQELSDEHPQATLEGPLAITMAVGENVTYVTTIVSKIDAKAVILQESCLLMLAEII